MKSKQRMIWLALLVIALALMTVAPAGAAGGVQWFHWDACRTVFEWQADDVAVDGWTVEYHWSGGGVIWSSPLVPADGSGLYSTPAPTAFEAVGALLCEHDGGVSVCKLEAVEVCQPTAKARRG